MKPIPTFQSVSDCEAELPIRVVDNIRTTAEFIDLAPSIGTLIELSEGKVCQELYVTDSKDAKPNTLSSRYGIGIFPFHTDTAFWKLPARWVLLRAVSGDLDRPTHLQSFQKLFQGVSRSLVRRSAWICDPGIGRRYSTISFIHEGREGFRYDLNCMTPANNAARQVDEMVRDRCFDLKGDTIKWIPNRVAIIDNWAWLHARGDSSAFAGTQSRILQRIYLK